MILIERSNNKALAVFEFIGRVGVNASLPSSKTAPFRAFIEDLTFSRIAVGRDDESQTLLSLWDRFAYNTLDS